MSYFQRSRKGKKVDLFNHSVLENGGLSHDFNSHAIPCLRVSCELNLGEGAFANCSTHLILADLSPHLLHSFSTIIHLQLQFREDNLETQFSYSRIAVFWDWNLILQHRTTLTSVTRKEPRVEMRRRIGIFQNWKEKKKRESKKTDKMENGVCMASCQCPHRLTLLLSVPIKDT